jgi:hypothetical protein
LTPASLKCEKALAEAFCALRSGGRVAFTFSLPTLPSAKGGSLPLQNWIHRADAYQFRMTIVWHRSDQICDDQVIQAIRSLL